MYYNNILIPGEDIVFLLSTKAANTSIKTSLAEAFIADEYVSVHRAFERVSPKEIEERCRGFLTIAFVRNPYDRIVSCWKDKVIGRGVGLKFGHGVEMGQTIQNFIKAVAKIPDSKSDVHYVSQHYSMLHNGNFLAEHVFKYEDLPESWYLIQDLIYFYTGVKVPDLKKINTSLSRLKPEHLLDDVSIELINERYKKDFELFNYDYFKREIR